MLPKPVLERTGALGYFWRAKAGKISRVPKFLNLLRLVATGSDRAQEGDINQLRSKFGGAVDRDLVDLAVLGKMTIGGEERAAVEEYYRRECELFGINPGTFAPIETVPSERRRTQE